MKRNFLLLLSLSLIMQTVSAARISEDEARQKAQVQLAVGALSRGQGIDTSMRLVTADIGLANLFVFNSEHEGNGFVIVSADDVTAPILGYSDRGSVTADRLSPELDYWLREMNRQVEEASRQSSRHFSASFSGFRAPAFHDAIEPMVTTLWDQTEPYNLQLYTSSNSYVTGCVATAMAQIMNYHRWPQGVTEKVASPMGKGLLDLEPTTFDWNLMRDSYGYGDTDEGAKEVAKLMAYCGYVSKMDYTMGSSGATEGNAVEGICHYMGYASTTELVYRMNYTATEWDALIYNELVNKRPVLYMGHSFGGGHAFVCDGYDGKGYFHINWGWGGVSNGYFLLSVLNPDEQGVGGSAAEDGYSAWQCAIIGMQKSEEASDALRLTVNRVFTQAKSATRASAGEDFSLKVYAYINNSLDKATDKTYDTALGLYQGETLLSVFPIAEGKSAKAGAQITGNTTISLGSSLSDGIYQVKALHRLNGSSQWMTPLMAQSRYLQLAVDGLTLTPTEVRSNTGDTRDLTKLRVNSVTLNGSQFAGKPLEVVANVTNIGTTNTGMLYLLLSPSADFSDPSAGAITYVGVNLDPGETTNVTLHYRPDAAGTDYLRLVDPDDGNVLYELTATILQPVPASLAVNATVDQAEQRENNRYTLPGNTARVVLDVTNTGSVVYEDYLITFIFSKLPEDTSWPSSSTYRRQYVNIAPGTTERFVFEFEGLDAIREYTFSSYYMDGSERRPLSGTGYGIYIPSQVDAISPIRYSEMPTTTIYDLQGRRVQYPRKGIYIQDGCKVVR